MRTTPKTGLWAFSNTDHVAIMSSISETPREATAIIPELDEIMSLAESDEMLASETADTPMGDVTA
jgi:hypothetical protein